MQPLHALTKKEAFGDWKEDHQKAFDAVKEKLMSAPVLAPPRLGKPFVVETDASATAIAACLLQENAIGETHPIAYASRLLNKHEAKYPSVESETLAIVFALKEFSPYLEGSGTSTVRTDNSALPALLKKRDLAGRLAKYQMSIQPFDLNIVHRSGKFNAFCDFLSRYPGDKVCVVSTRAQMSRQASNDEPGADHTSGAQVEAPVETLTLERIRGEQKLVKDYRLMYDALKHGRFPDDIAEQKCIREAVKCMKLEKGLLCHCDPEDEDDAARILVPYPLREEIVRRFHEPPLEGGHLGADRTAHRLRQRFYWPGLVSDVRIFTRSCDACQKRKSVPALMSTEPLHMMPVARSPFERVHADIMGPIPITGRQHRYILVVVDSFTKWLIAEPIVDQKATTVSTVFLNRVVAQHGAPSMVVTDQGRQFVGKIFADVATLFNFQHRTTTAYHQQANGMVERQNQTLAAMLSAYVNRQGDDWDKFLASVTFAYNTSVQASSRQSPFFLLYLRDARVPLDNVLELQSGAAYGTTTLYAEEAGLAIRAAWESAQEHLEKSQASQKRHADDLRRTAEHEFKPFQLVLLFRDQPPTSESHKFRKRWEGPFRIMKVERPNVIVRKLTGDARLKTVHMDKVKPYYEATTLPLHSSDNSALDADTHLGLSAYREPGDQRLELEDDDAEDADVNISHSDD
ncbi:hypothetical protein AAVH_12899 [Aphelenchoides avenae]|nr:hypothetical protein AAVH_12899 [Aphelenchus avenae]